MTFTIRIPNKFPSKHPRRYQATGFVIAMQEKRFLHFIMKDYAKWKRYMDLIEAGEGCLSIQEWTSAPSKRGSSLSELYNLKASDGIGIEKLVFKDGQPFIEGVPPEAIKANYGLSEQDFDSWFRDADPTAEYAIIHLTEFRYHGGTRGTASAIGDGKK